MVEMVHIGEEAPDQDEIVPDKKDDEGAPAGKVLFSK